MLMRWTSLTLLLFSSLLAPASEVLDRVVAVVNGHVILLSDWNDELRFECLMSGHKLTDVGSDEKKAALDRLVDQELLRQQIRATDAKPVAPEQVQKQLKSLKRDYLREHAGESWEMSISRYQLSEKFITAHVDAELQELQLIDTRFRSSIQVSAAEIEKYYHQQFVPRLPPSDPASLSDATPQIREILLQDKINQLLAAWLETLRGQAQIRILTQADSASDHKSAQAGAQ
jgi:peptidyl-prolyl cis-trans isomerase SurA